MKNRIFLPNGVELRALRVQRAYLDGSLVVSDPNSSVAENWRAKCSVPNCNRTYSLGSVTAKTFLEKICNKHFRQQQIKPAQEKVRRQYRVWLDGGKIYAPRLIAAFDSGQLVRRKLYGNTPHYFARCTEVGCEGDYNFSAPHLAEFRQKKCYIHIKGEGQAAKRNAVLVNGVSTTSHFLQKNASRVIWRKPYRGKKLQPYMKCETEGCKQLRKYNLDGRNQNQLLCKFCVRRRRKPYFATFNAFVAQCKKRNTVRREPLSMHITYDQFIEFCDQFPRCFYCDIDLLRLKYFYKPPPGVHGSRAACLDRIDVRKGYSIDNVVSCCGPCNRTRGVLVSFEEMKIIGKLRQGKLREASALLKENGHESVTWARWCKDYRIHGTVFGRKWEIRADKKGLV